MGNYYGRPVVIGFPREGTGSKQQMRSTSLEQRVKTGDILTAVNGLDVRTLPFHVALSLMVNCEGNFLYLRFLRTVERGGPGGAKERALARSQRIARLAAEGAENQSAAMANGHSAAQIDEVVVVPEDDPEQDVVQRYANKFGHAIVKCASCWDTIAVSRSVSHFLNQCNITRRTGVLVGYLRCLCLQVGLRTIAIQRFEQREIVSVKYGRRCQ